MGGKSTMAQDDDSAFDASLFIDTHYVPHELTFGAEKLTVLALNSAATDFDLTGQVIWGGCQLLGLYMVSNKHVVAGKKVLELGSGAGVCGLLASTLCGAREVVLTDYKDTVLDLLKTNTQQFPSPPASPMQVQNLTWGEDVDIFVSKYGRFEVLLGADVIYWPAAIVPLLDTAQALLEPTADACFYLGYCDRAAATTCSLMSEAKTRGFDVTEIPTDDPMYADVKNLGRSDGRPYYLYVLKWANPPDSQ
eukprot:comp12680_c0_seq1/m.7772 comp12680_c0_seq1/g.7772  ORF comp12680_c0_seq1/g.7772 comp12680_c0_seq1/m.7772 type:complete len:250 (-) comp12680_c0_seq1:15-764(-)